MIKIVTDSVASIPKEEAKRLGLEVVTLYVNHNGQEFADADLDLDEFYAGINEMVDNIPTTSQPSQHVFESIFEKAAKAGDEVLGVFISSKFSGCFDGAIRAARAVQSRNIDFKCILMDSTSNGYDEAWPVYDAVDKRDAGGTLEDCAAAVWSGITCTRWLFTPESLTFLRKGGRIGGAAALLGNAIKLVLEDCAAAVWSGITCTRWLFTPESLTFLRKGGRIGGAAALLGNAIKLVPILTVIDGAAETFAKVRTRKKALDRIVQKLKEDMSLHGLKRLAVHYIGDKAPALEWARETIVPLVGREVPVLPVSPVLGVHVGPAVGIAYECNTPIEGKLTVPYDESIFAMGV